MSRRGQKLQSSVFGLQPSSARSMNPRGSVRDIRVSWNFVTACRSRGTDVVKMTSGIWLLKSLLLLSCISAAHAEGGCPPGQYPQSGQGWQTCVPIPGYEQAHATQPPAVTWTPQWGAIATDAIKGALGAADDLDSRASAETRALAICEQKGGSTCKVNASYANGCGVMTVGSNGFSVASAATEKEAIQESLRRCGADGDTKCQVYYKGCSAPRQK
jgi:hypothetical protein